jgi:hypothetical protein
VLRSIVSHTKIGLRKVCPQRAILQMNYAKANTIYLNLGLFKLVPTLRLAKRLVPFCLAYYNSFPVTILASTTFSTYYFSDTTFTSKHQYQKTNSFSTFEENQTFTTKIISKVLLFICCDINFELTL